MAISNSQYILDKKRFLLWLLWENWINQLNPFIKYLSFYLNLLEKALYKNSDKKLHLWEGYGIVY